MPTDPGARGRGGCLNWDHLEEGGFGAVDLGEVYFDLTVRSLEQEARLTMKNCSKVLEGVELTGIAMLTV